MGEADSAYHITVSDATKDGEVVKFTIQTRTNESPGNEGGGVVVLRQFEDFEYLLHKLQTTNDVSGVVVPQLPIKPISTPADAKAKQPDAVSTMSGDQYARDCKRVEKFLQSLASHASFKNDEILKTFLMQEEAPARAAVKRGLFDSLYKMVDSARYQNYKDVDEEFQSKRDLIGQLLQHTKTSLVDSEKKLSTENVLAAHLGIMSTDLRSSSSTDCPNSPLLSSLLSQCGDAIDDCAVRDQKSTLIEAETLGFSLEFYSRHLAACQEMLFRRTCKMVEYENAKKALEKAKPKTLEQLTKARDDAEKAFDDISEKAKEEYGIFVEERVKDVSQFLSDLVDRKLEIHKSSCDRLAKAVEELNASL